MASPVVPIPNCPGKSFITFEKHWYQLPSVDLDICSRCFADHLARTPFAHHFVISQAVSGTERSCDFDTPRIRAELSRALQANDINILRDYMKFRVQLKPCKDNIMIADGFKWWGPLSGSIEDFAVCEACYEDYIVPRGWTGQFKDSPEPQLSEPYTCNTGMALGIRAAKNSPTFDQFKHTALQFFTLPGCKAYEAHDPSSDSQTWYKMRPQDLSHLWICESCYYDVIAATDLEPHAYAVGRQNTGAPLLCSVGSVLPLKIAFTWGRVRNDFNVFYRAAQVIARNPPCTKEGMGPEANWMTLNPACEEFAACGACFAAFVEAPGFPDRYNQFMRAHVAPGTTLLCDLNPHAIGVRAAKYFNFLDEAVETGDPRKFTEPVRAIAAAPHCPGAVPQRELVWYLNNTYACCPECWAIIVRGTRLDHRAFPQRRNENVGWDMPLKCDFWSPRVRQLWKEAVSKEDLTDFDNFMVARLQVFGKTWPEINNLRGMMRNESMQQMNMYQNSFIMSIGSSVSAAAGSGTGSYGNSSIGYYPTMSGAQSAQLFNQASGMNTNHGPTLQRIAELEAQWKAVE